jgi:hypothetical protein
MRQPQQEHNEEMVEDEHEHHSFLLVVVEVLLQMDEHEADLRQELDELVQLIVYLVHQLHTHEVEDEVLLYNEQQNDLEDLDEDDQGQHSQLHQ